MEIRFLLIFILILTAIGMSYVSLLIKKRDQAAKKKYLLGLSLASVLYSAGSALELSGDSVTWVLWAYKIQYAGIAFIPALILLTAGDYIASYLWRTKVIKFFLFSISSITFILVVTEPYHNWMHQNPRMIFDGPFPVPTFDQGSWYLVHIIYMNLALFLANLIFLNSWIKAPASHRHQSAMLFLGSLLPWTTLLIYLSGTMSWPLDISPFALGGSTYVMYKGIISYGLAEIIPIARGLVFENMYDAALVLDKTGYVVDYNSSASRLFLTSTGRLAGKTLNALTHPYPELKVFVEAAFAQSSERSRDITLDSRTYNIRLIDILAKRGDITGHILVFRDITDYARLLDQMKQLASIDELTGIPNRRHFSESAHRELKRSRRNLDWLSILMIDIDHFKNVNDTYGHTIGDEVLKKTAQMALGTLRVTDLIGRYGGEEFCVCLTETDLERSIIAAERLRQAVASLQFGDSLHPFQITISIGLYSSPGDEIDITLDSMISRADVALYQAKNAGRNCTRPYQEKENTAPPQTIS